MPMSRWWPDNPLRGVSLRERTRLTKLSVAEVLISDENDGRAVRAFYEYQRWFQTTVAFRFLFRVGPWLVIPSFMLVMVGSAVVGRWVDVALSLAALTAYGFALQAARSRRSKLDSTARINGWT